MKWTTNTNRHYKIDHILWYGCPLERRFNEFSGQRKSLSGIPRWQPAVGRVPMTETVGVTIINCTETKKKKKNEDIYYIYIYNTYIIRKHRKGSFGGDVLYRRHHNYKTRIINRVLLYRYLASLVEFASYKLKPRIVFKSDSIVWGQIQR